MSGGKRRLVNKSQSGGLGQLSKWHVLQERNPN